MQSKYWSIRNAADAKASSVIEAVRAAIAASDYLFFTDAAQYVEQALPGAHNAKARNTELSTLRTDMRRAAMKGEKPFTVKKIKPKGQGGKVSAVWTVVAVKPTKRSGLARSVRSTTTEAQVLAYVAAHRDDGAFLGKLVGLMQPA